MADPTPQVTALGSQLRKQLDALAKYATADYKATTLAGYPQWFMPAGFTDDLFSLSAISKPFVRDQHSQEFNNAVSKPGAPGTAGDMLLSTMQGDILAALERAFRNRHRSSVRNKIHAAARRYGHGNNPGVIATGMTNYLERLIKANSPSSSSGTATS